MKVKLTWKYHYDDEYHKRDIDYEYAATPLGNITVGIATRPDYMKPYSLNIPGQVTSKHTTREEAKAAAETYLNSKLSDFIDTTT